MKKILIVLFIIPVFISAKIVETNCFSDILTHVASDTLVVCDIDNTLTESQQHLGSTQWGEHLFDHFCSSGKSPEEAYALEGDCWRKVQPYIKVRPVETQTPAIIQQLQRQGVVVMALTARHPNELEYTREQLGSVGIYLEKVAIAKENIWLPMKKQPALYSQGILFCSTDNQKDEVIAAFLKKINYQPKKIVFIDDKRRHVEALDTHFSASSIDHVGLRYGASDKRVQAFHPRIAEIQLEALPRIISDEEASCLFLKEKNSLQKNENPLE